MRSPRSDAAEEVRTDMTPMIDAVFLLIVFFLCIDFRTLEARLPAHLPKDRGANAPAVDQLEELKVRIVCNRFGEKVPRREGQALVDPGTGRTAPFMLVGHDVHWTLGPVTIGEPDRLTQELARIAADPSRLVPDPARPGGTRTPPVVVEPGPGATYGDVAATVDAVRAAGFDDLTFAGALRRRTRGR